MVVSPLAGVPSVAQERDVTSDVDAIEDRAAAHDGTSLTVEEQDHVEPLLRGVDAACRSDDETGAPTARLSMICVPLPIAPTIDAVPVVALIVYKTACPPLLSAPKRVPSGAQSSAEVKPSCVMPRSPISVVMPVFGLGLPWDPPIRSSLEVPVSIA